MAITNRNSYYERKNYIEETRAHNEMIFNNTSIYDVLDDTIGAYLTEYQIMHDFKRDDFISESEQNGMIKDVSTRIIEEMSPIFTNQLACYFNKDIIPAMIVRRVTIVVAGIVAETNNRVKITNINNIGNDISSNIDNMISRY